MVTYNFFSLETKFHGQGAHLFGLYCKVSEGLSLTLTNGVKSWEGLVTTGEAPLVKVEGSETLLQLLEKCLKSPGTANFVVEATKEGNEVLIVKVDTFIISRIQLQLKDEIALKFILMQVFEREASLRHVESLNKQMEETNNKLRDIVKTRIKADVCMQDELSLQFLQVLNKKKEYNLQLKQENHLLKDQIEDLKKQLAAAVSNRRQRNMSNDSVENERPGTFQEAIKESETFQEVTKADDEESEEYEEGLLSGDETEGQKNLFTF